MAKLKIKKYQNNNSKMTQSYGKTYGRIESAGVLDTLDLAKHIQKHGSIYTRDVIVGVLEKFSMCIEELLQEGYRVKLNGLGTFYLSVKTKGASNAEEFDKSNIDRVSIKFTADRSKDYDWSSAMQTLTSQFNIAGAKEDSGSGSGSGSGGNGGGNSDPIEDRP